jgi:hypothetical protein
VVGYAIAAGGKSEGLAKSAKSIILPVFGP